MKKESSPGRRARCAEIISRLRHAYPDARCSLDYTNPLELLVATVLSAQCTDKRVNIVTKTLFKKYRTAADYAQAPPGELEADIRSTGFYRNKAKSLRACCADLVAKHRSQVPDTLESLTSLHGIGRKTANVILGNAFAKAEGIVVDTHVSRLTQRMGLTRQKTPEKIEQDLMTVVPRKDWIDFAHLLIFHGRRRCMARNPDCAHCEVNRLCPKISVTK